MKKDAVTYIQNALDNGQLTAEDIYHLTLAFQSLSLIPRDGKPGEWTKRQSRYIAGLNDD